MPIKKRSLLRRRRHWHAKVVHAVCLGFVPRWIPDTELLHVRGKRQTANTSTVAHVGISPISRRELPDIVVYSQTKNWLYLIEAVHSSGPISQLRLLELERLTKDCTAEIIYVTAFLDRDTFRKFAPDIAWETEVWIADAPDHLIHFDGDKFLGPYKKPD